MHTHLYVGVRQLNSDRLIIRLDWGWQTFFVKDLIVKILNSVGRMANSKIFTQGVIIQKSKFKILKS